MRPRLVFFSQTSPRVVLFVLQAALLRPESDYLLRPESPAAAMLPASLLRRPGLSRLVRQARAYAEAAAAPAPAAGPGQMSFTFASPTQVRTLFRTPDPRPFPVWSLSESSNPIPDPGSEPADPQVADTHSGLQTGALPPCGPSLSPPTPIPDLGS